MASQDGEVASDDAIGSFAQDGVAVIRSVIQPELLEVLGRDIDEIRIASGDSGSDDFLALKSFESFQDVALRSPLPGHAADFLDSFKIRYFFDLVLSETSSRIEQWQQDQPFSGIDGRSITAWLAVDRIDKKNSPQFWAGSHLGSWYLPAEMVGVAQPANGQAVAAIPDLVGQQSSYDTRGWAMEPGDVVYASSLTVHWLPKSLAGLRVVSFTFVDAHAVWVNRPWATVPEASVIRGQAREGEALDPESFPRAWPQEKQ